MINKKNLALIIAVFSATITLVNASTDDIESPRSSSPNSHTELSMSPRSEDSILSSSPPKIVDNSNWAIDTLYKSAWSLVQEEKKEEAFEMMMKTAEKNHGEACFFVATWLQRGEGCTQDTQKALEWYEKSYTFGCSDAANKLGIYYEDTAKNYDLALDWYEKGALLNHDLALKNLERLLNKLDDSDETQK